MGGLNVCKLMDQSTWVHPAYQILRVIIAISNNRCLFPAGMASAALPHQENTMAPWEGFPCQHCLRWYGNQANFFPMVAGKKCAQSVTCLIQNTLLNSATWSLHLDWGGLIVHNGLQCPIYFILTVCFLCHVINKKHYYSSVRTCTSTHNCVSTATKLHINLITKSSDPSLYKWGQTILGASTVILL